MSTKETPLASGAIVSHKSAVRMEREKPPFAAQTAGKMAPAALLGAVGGVISANAMISSGNTIVRENGVEDPANWISSELAAAMSQKYGVRFAGSRKVTGEEPAEIAGACAGADYALDVRTINWSFVYFPVNWATYRVIYSAKMRLIDCRTGKVIAEGFHARVPEKTEQSPSYDNLVDGGAAGLKRELKIGAKESLDHFKRDILKL